MSVENLTNEEVLKMSDDEILQCFEEVQKAEQMKGMRQALVKYVSQRDESRRTIKIPSRVIS